MTYLWQDKQNFVFLNDFAQFLPGTNFVGGAFEVLSASAKICQVATNLACLAWRFLSNLRALGKFSRLRRFVCSR